MATNTVFTSPKAYITIGNKPAGYIRSLTCNESIQRAEVKGLGNLTNQEVPAVGHSGTFSCDFFFIDFKQPYVKELINRNGGLEAFKNTLVLGEFPFSIVIYKRTATTVDQTNKLVTAADKTGETILVINECYIDSQNFQISEGGIASYNTSGRFLQPTTLNP